MTVPRFPKDWKVFPVKNNSKEPQFYGWAKEATDDPAQIEAWTIQYPDCNWGLACGPSGLAVIDIDPPLGEESLFQFELEHDLLPKTREHTSARGGRHLIYLGEIKPTVSILGPKLDTRGGNSYILIPPSTFEGKPYAVSEDRELATLPSFVSDAAGASRQHVSASDGLVCDTGIAKVRADALIKRYIEEDYVAIEGQGGDALTYAVAAEVINLGLSPEAALDALMPWNDACQPPWPVDELRVKIENASRYSQNEAGAWYVPPVSERIPQEALDKLIEESKAPVPADQGGRSRFHFMDEDEFSNIPPPVWLLKDRLMRDSITLFYGPSGHYKSFLALNLAAEVAQMGECAFYVAAEGIARMARKDFPAWKLAYGEDKKLPLFMTDHMPKAFTPDDFMAFADAIAARAKGKPVGVIVLDTLNRAMSGLNDNDAKDASRMVDCAEFLKKQFKCCVILVHHTPKYDKETWRGSGVFYNDFDTVLAVHADKAVKLVKITVVKQKTDEEFPKPYWYEGKRFGPGMAFVPVEEKAASSLLDEADIYAPAKVSAALKSLKAWEPVTVSTQVLVGHLVPELQNESPEARGNSVARGLIAFKAAMKRYPQGYKGYHDEAVGKPLKWSLPAPE